MDQIEFNLSRTEFHEGEINYLGENIWTYLELISTYLELNWSFFKIILTYIVIIRDRCQ